MLRAFTHVTTLFHGCLFRRSTTLSLPSSFPQSKQAVGLQIKAITSQVAVKQVYIQQCDAEAASAQIKAAQSEKAAVAANIKAAAARKEAEDAEKKALSAKQGLRLVAAALLPLKRSLFDSDTKPESRPYPAVRGSNAGTHSAERGKCIRSRTSNPSERVIYVKSNDLEVVLEMMRASSSPAIYDFQGRDMLYTGEGSPTICSNGITWRNGNVMLGPGMGLKIVSTGVELQSLSVIGGRFGLWVASSGNVTLTSCLSRHADCGIHLEGKGNLVARSLKVMDCKKDALNLTGSSSAILVDSELCGAKLGISMEGSSSMLGTRILVTGIEGYVLMLNDVAKMELNNSTLSVTPQKLIGVMGAASLVMSGCVSDQKIIRNTLAHVRVDL